MPLPTNRELREAINAAAPAPWFIETMDDISPTGGENKSLWLIGDGYYFIAETKAPASTAAHYIANFRLAALAPQLAEEVIRLRSEVNRLTQSEEGDE